MQAAVRHGAGNIGYDGARCHPDLPCDGHIGQVLELCHEKGALDLLAQGTQQLIEFQQGFAQKPLLFGRRGQFLWEHREHFQVGGFQTAATMEIERQAVADRGQVGARFLQHLHIGLAQQAQKDILREIGCISGIADTPAQPGDEPAVMAGMKRAHIERLNCGVLGHCALPFTSRQS